MALSGTSRCDPPPPPEEVTIPFDAFRMDLPAQSPVANLDRTLTFYGGARVRNFSLSLDIAGLAPNGRVEVQDGTGAVLQTITANGPITTVPFGGNVGRIRVRIPGPAPSAPDVRVLRMEATRQESIVYPSGPEPLANTVAAFPLQLGQPVDFALHDTRSDHFFFTVDGLEGREFDVILIGAATLAVGDPQQHGFPLPSGPSLATVVPERTRPAGVGFPGIVLARFPATSRGAVHITVTNQGFPRVNGARDPFRTRIVVVPAGPPQLLAFPSVVPNAFFPASTGMDHDGAGVFPPTLTTVLQCVNYGGHSPAPNLPGPPGPPICYDGHLGTDYGIAPGSMEADVPVNAAASGFVVETATGNVDTCGFDLASSTVVCPGTPALLANFVTVRQDDGRFARYYHLRNQPLGVAAGDRVSCGQFLGRVGSSGISSSAHLHFELRTLPVDSAAAVTRIDQRVGQAGVALDPYPDLWRVKGPADIPLPAC